MAGLSSSSTIFPIWPSSQRKNIGGFNATELGTSWYLLGLLLRSLLRQVFWPRFRCWKRLGADRKPRRRKRRVPVRVRSPCGQEMRKKKPWFYAPQNGSDVKFHQFLAALKSHSNRSMFQRHKISDLARDELLKFMARGLFGNLKFL